MQGCKCATCQNEGISKSNIVQKVDEYVVDGDLYSVYIFADDEPHQDQSGSSIIFIVSDAEEDYLICIDDDEQPEIKEDDEDTHLVFYIRCETKLSDAKTAAIHEVVEKFTTKLLNEVLPEMQK